MTVIANDRIAGPFACTGGETVFPYDFKLLAATDLVVKRRRGGADATLVYSADYLVSGVGNPGGGNVTLLAAAVDGDKVVLIGARPAVRLSDLSVQAVLSGQQLNPEYDALQVQLAEVNSRLDRALLRSPFDAAAGPLELPPAEPNTVIGFDGDGNPDLFAPGGGGGGASIPDPLPIDDGGTGATSVGQAQTNLGIVPAASIPGVVNSAMTATPALFRTALGLGALATRNTAQTTHIDDDAVTLAKQAAGPANFYQGWDANGDPAALAPVALVKVRALGKATGFAGGQVRHWITDDNALWAAGSNALLANGYLSASTDVPVKVTFSTPPATITKVVVSATSVYVLDANGRVYSFGGNAKGQLGHGDTASRGVATRIEWLVSNGVTVADIFASSDTGAAGANQDYVFFLGTNGRAYACGANGSGQLGLGDTTDRSSPVLVASPTSVAHIAPAGNVLPHTMLVTTAGALYGTGANATGQLGLGDTTGRTSFAQVSGVTNAARCECASASAGGSTILLRTNATIWSTGLNGAGQLGLGDTANRSAFIQIGTFNQVVDIAMTRAADTATVAFRSSTGQVHIFGHNAAGACGTNNTTNQTSPQAPSASFQGYATKIAAGGAGATAGIFVLDNTNKVWAAGYSTHGNLGTGQLSATNLYFVELVGLSGTVTDIVATGSASSNGSWGLSILYDDGRAAVTGDNAAGQLGLGTGTGDANVVAEVTLLSRAGPRGATGNTGPTGATGPNTGLDYAFDTLTGDADPTAGKLRLNNAAWGSATFLYVSKTGRNGESLGTQIANLLSSTSARRAHVRLFSLANRAQYLEADVMAAATDGSTYWKIPLSNVDASASMPASNAVMALMIDRSGDTGSPSSSGVPHTSDVSGAVPTNVFVHLKRTFDWVADGGAGGNDSADNDTPFGRLANALLDGRECVVPAGIYRVNNAAASLSLTAKGAKLIGQGGGSVIKRMQNLTSPLFIFDGANACVEDIELAYSNASTAVDGNHQPIRFVNGRKVRTKNVFVTGRWYAGLEDRDGEDCLHVGARAFGVVNRGLYREAVSNDSIDVAFIGCVVDGETVTTYGYNQNQATGRTCLGGGIFNSRIRRVTHQGIALCGLGGQAIGNFVKDVSDAAGVGILNQAPNSSSTQRTRIANNNIMNVATGIADNQGLYTQIDDNDILATAIGIAKTAAAEGRTFGGTITTATNNAIAVSLTGNASAACSEEYVGGLRIRQSGTGTTAIATAASSGGNLGTATCTIDKSSIVIAGSVTPYALGGTGHYTPIRRHLHANLAAFPATGDAEVTYLDATTGAEYRWNGSAYVQTGRTFLAQVSITTNGVPLVLDSSNSAQPIQLKTAGVTRSYFGAAAASPLFVQGPNGHTALLISDASNGGTIANYLQAIANVAGGAVILQAAGSDTDIDMAVKAKGAGKVDLTTPTTTTAPSAGGAGALPATPLGYLQMKLAGSAIRVPYYG